MTPGADGVQTEGVSVVISGGVALIRIDRPGARNALSAATLLSLDAAFSSLTTRDDLSAVVFTGAGDTFAAGADIRELRALTPALAREFAARGQKLMDRIERAPQLTIAAVNGYCMGGGLDLALACRVRCAAARAVFAHPGARLGIITGWGGTQRLPRLIGPARAIELFATARRVSCDEALALGLVDRLGDPVVECALELARKLTGRS